jgi:signal transduction histidine kinase
MYSDLFERPPEFSSCSIEDLMRRALDRVEPKEKLERVRIEFEIDRLASHVKVDSTGASDMFRCLLQNSLDAVDDGDPYIKISSRPVPGPGSRVDVEIFNTGRPPDPEELDQLFSPFYSTKSWGTGFGLSIARLAVRKNFGKLRLMPLPGQGMRVVVTLSDATAG